MYSNENYLRQLPRCNAGIVERATEKKVTSVYEMLELENEDREYILQLEGSQLADVAKFCNHYPSIEVEYELESDTVTSQDNMMVAVTLTRDNHIDGMAPPVVAPLFPQKRKEEGWWLVVGDPDNNSLLTIKRLVINEESTVKLDFAAPKPGRHNFKLYFISDSYLGADQEFEVKFRVEDVGKGSRKRKHEKEEEEHD